MFHIFSVTGFLFLAMFIGFIFGKLKIFSTESSSILIRYVFYLALPASLFLGCYKAKLTLLNLNYLTSYTCTEIAIVIIYFIISRTYLHEKSTTSFLNAMSVTQVDGAYFAIPLLVLLYGSAASIIPLMFIQNVIFFTLLIFCINLFQVNDIQQKPNIAKLIYHKINHVLFKNPIILSSIFGFLLSVLQVKIPVGVLNFLQFFGTSSSPVALFALGLSFSASFNVAWKMHDEKKEIIILTIGKVLLFPLAAWFIGTLFSVPKEFLLPLVLFCATPAATHTFIIAHQYKLNERIQTNVIVLSTIFSFFTISLFLYFLS